MSSESKLSLSAQSIDNAEPNAKPILDKALEQVGFIPNMYGLMVNSPALLDTYLHGYKLFKEQSDLTPAEQEIVFLVISYENNCHYCVAAHSMLADKMSNVPAEVTQAIRDGAAIPDAKLQALNVMTTKMVETRGNPSKADVNAFVAAGYSEKNVLEIVLAIAVKTLSNYSNHLFDTPVDDMFSDYTWQKRQ